MELEIENYFDKAFRSLEESLNIGLIHGVKYVPFSEISQEELAGVVNLEVGFGEENSFYIIFNGYEERIKNISAAEEVFRKPELRNYGHVVISNSFMD